MLFVQTVFMRTQRFEETGFMDHESARLLSFAAILYVLQDNLYKASDITVFYGLSLINTYFHG